MGAGLAIIVSTVIGAGTSAYAAEENRKYSEKQAQKAKEYAAGVKDPSFEEGERFTKEASDIRSRYKETAPQLDTDYFKMWDTKLTELEAPAEAKAIQGSIETSSFLDPYGYGGGSYNKATDELRTNIMADRSIRTMSIAREEQDQRRREHEERLSGEMSDLRTKWGMYDIEKQKKEDAEYASKLVDLQQPRQQSWFEQFSPYAVQAGMQYGVQKASRPTTPTATPTTPTATPTAGSPYNYAINPPLPQEVWGQPPNMYDRYRG